MNQDAGIAFYQLRNDPLFQQGLKRGGPLLDKGSLVLGPDDCTVPAASFDAGTAFDAAVAQECALEQWANGNQYWYSDPHAHYRGCGYQFYGFGGEAQVYIDEDRYVHKICRIGQYGSLRRFFDRIIIENMICPVASLWIEGFGRDTESDFVVLMR